MGAGGFAVGDGVRFRVPWAGYPAGTQAVVIGSFGSVGRTLLTVAVTGVDGRQHELEGIRPIDLEPLETNELGQ